MNMEKWLDTEFESSSGLTPDFSRFAGEFRQAIKRQLAKGQTLVGWNRGHFYVSGFIKQGDKFVYFSISDVRYFSKEWHDSILYRTAKDSKDFTGGTNRYTTLSHFGKAVSYLLGAK